MQSSIVAKILKLVTIVSDARKPLTFSELVTKSEMNKSTMHRLLSICSEENLVQYDAHRKGYLLGPKVFDLVRNAYSGYDIQAIALDEMLALHAKFDTNVTIGVPSGNEVVYLRVLEARSSQRAAQQPGMREPFHCSASGKAIFAFLPDAIVDAKMAAHDFKRFTDRTITDPAAFKATLNDVRTSGYAQNDREEYEYFNGISAPIFNYLGEPIAVLNMWCEAAQYPIDDMAQWAEELVASAERITALINGQKPDLADLS